MPSSMGTWVVGWHCVGAALVVALPQGSAGRIRAEILARCGWSLGRGVTIAGLPRLAGKGALLRRLRVGDGVFVNVGGYWELNERIDIGDGSSLGHECRLQRSRHPRSRGRAVRPRRTVFGAKPRYSTTVRTSDRGRRPRPKPFGPMRPNYAPPSAEPRGSTPGDLDFSGRRARSTPLRGSGSNELRPPSTRPVTGFDLAGSRRG